MCDVPAYRRLGPVERGQHAISIASKPFPDCRDHLAGEGLLGQHTVPGAGHAHEHQDHVLVGDGDGGLEHVLQVQVPGKLAVGVPDREPGEAGAD